MFYCTQQNKIFYLKKAKKSSPPLSQSYLKLDITHHIPTDLEK